MLIMALFDDLGTRILGGLRFLAAVICKLLYSIIAGLYDIFMAIASLDILQTDAIKQIYSRITMILAIVMVFYVTFQFVKYAVQPDSISDKEKGVGNILYKMIAVVVLIAFVPTLFQGAYSLQGKVIKSQLFSKVILGKVDVSTGTYGRNFSANIFTMFYSFDEQKWSSDNKCEDDISCKNIVNANIAELINGGEMPYLELGMASKGKAETIEAGKKNAVFKIDFDGLFAVVVGGFMAWMLAMYCIDAGTRYVQLIFLQVIAPIPIIGYLSPKKDGIFQKWLKQCITTYLDLFIRLGIIYFILLLCEILSGMYHDGSLFANLKNLELGVWLEKFTYLALIMGLLAFAKKAPKMLEELFPKMGAAGGEFGIGGSSRLKPTGDALKAVGKGLNTAKRAVGGTAGAILGGITGARTGRAIAGAIEGAKKGGAKKGGLIGNVATGVRSVGESVQKDLDVKEAGGSYYGARFFSGINSSSAKEQDRQVARCEAVVKKKDEVGTSIKELKVMKRMQSLRDTAVASGNTDEASKWEQLMKQTEDLARTTAASGNTGAFQTQFDALIANNASPDTKQALMDLANDPNSPTWSTIKTNLEEAASAAKEAGVGESTDYASLEAFANSLGGLAKSATSKATKLKADKKYKATHANSTGKK